MSILQHIHLVQFKNHLQKTLDFEKRITGIIGTNGVGKTNILDAIYYLCSSRSYFSKSDKLVQNFNLQGFRVDGRFQQQDKILEAKCILREDGKKELYLNQDLVKKASDYIGFANCVMIAPDDIALINEGSENRRKFIDTVLCQMDKQYLQNLQQYNKILQQRNALLKAMWETPVKENTLLDIYNRQLCNHGAYIFKVRQAKIAILQEKILENYLYLANQSDAIAVQYESQLLEHDLLHLLENNLQKDLVTQRTNYGIHKDDLLFLMDQVQLKNVASQGQKKSFLLALKLAEYALLQSETTSTPILLLDDIFERLDDQRISRLFTYITKELHCQVFISDTNRKRLEQHLQACTNDYSIIDISVV